VEVNQILIVKRGRMQRKKKSQNEMKDEGNLVEESKKLLMLVECTMVTRVEKRWKDVERG
jgi:hypothetical protein